MDQKELFQTHNLKDCSTPLRSSFSFLCNSSCKVKFAVFRDVDFAFVSFMLCVHISPFGLSEVQYDGVSELFATQQAIDAENGLGVDHFSFQSRYNIPSINLSQLKRREFGRDIPTSRIGTFGRRLSKDACNKLNTCRENYTFTRYARPRSRARVRDVYFCRWKTGFVSPRRNANNNLYTILDDDSSAESKKVLPGGPVYTVYDV